MFIHTNRHLCNALNFLSKYEWQLKRMTNTAIGGKYIATKGENKNACIANMKTKEVYDLEVLKKILIMKRKIIRDFLLFQMRIL